MRFRSTVWRLALQQLLARRAAPSSRTRAIATTTPKALWGLVHWDLGLNAAAYVRDKGSKHAYNVLLAVEGGKLRIHVYDPGWGPAGITRRAMAGAIRPPMTLTTR